MALNVFLISLLSLLGTGSKVCSSTPHQDNSPATQSEERAVSPATRRMIEEPGESKHSLDDRINAEKITELPIPEVPENIILPNPPIHRIAKDASQTNLSSKEWQTAIRSITNGLTFLAATQSKRGAWFEGTEVIPTDQSPKEAAAAQAVTALALKAFAQAPNLSTSPLAQDRALQFIRRSIQHFLNPA